MDNTTYEDVINSFHSTFQDKVELPSALEEEWFNKAVGKFSYEIEKLNYDEDFEEFDSTLDRYVMALYIKWWSMVRFYLYIFCTIEK